MSSRDNGQWIPCFDADVQHQRGVGPPCWAQVFSVLIITGAHQRKPPSPLISGVNAFPSPGLS